MESITMSKGGAEPVGRMHWQRAAKAGIVQGEQQFPTRTRKPRVIPRFAIRQGTRCFIRRVSADDWQEYHTTRDLGFERFERYVRDDGGPWYEFRSGLWLLTVNRGDVVHREDVLAGDVALHVAGPKNGAP